MFDENISLEQLVQPSEIISVGAKWYGKPKFYYYDVEYEEGVELNGGLDRMGMLEMTHGLWQEAEAIVTFNGDKFDLTKLRGEFLRMGFSPPPPVASIDVRKTTSKMGYTSGKLAHVGPLLGCGSKIETGGFKLWTKYLDGDPIARSAMKRYNKQDVFLLEEVYTKVRPYITSHPYIGDKARRCPVCESEDVQQRGFRRTRSYKVARLHCQNCGAWSSGERIKLEKKK
jgi:hypothetical protein